MRKSGTHRKVSEQDVVGLEASILSATIREDTLVTKADVVSR